MKISKIETIPFKLPVRREFKWAGLQESVGGFVCVKITTDEGIVGYGEATPLPDWGGDYDRRGGETLNTVIDITQNVIAPVLIGTDPTNITNAHLKVNRVLRGNSYAKCAIDIALHDITGKALGVPIYKLLGGKVRENVPIGHMIGLMSNEEALIEAKGAYDDGIRAFQIKGGEDAKRDIELVHTLRSSLGDEVFLRLDINKGHRRPKHTLKVLEAMRLNGKDLLDMVEQPVEGFDHMAAVTARCSIPTIMDEGCWNCVDAIEAIRRRSTDAISIYLAKAGGLQPAGHIAVIAQKFNMQCDVNGSLESGIGTAANIHFAVAQPAVELPAVISINAPAGQHAYKFGGHFYEDDIIAEALPVKDGCLLPLENPGLGINVDLEKLEKYRVR